MYHFWVNVTMTYDLVLGLSCPKHISNIIWASNPKFGVWFHLGMAG